MSPDKVLCFHLKNIALFKTLLGSSFSIQKVKFWTAVRQLSDHVIKHFDVVRKGKNLLIYRTIVTGTS